MFSSFRKKSRKRSRKNAPPHPPKIEPESSHSPCNTMEPFSGTILDHCYKMSDTLPLVFPDYDQTCQDHCKVLVLVANHLTKAAKVRVKDGEDEDDPHGKLLAFLNTHYASHTLISADEGPKTYQFRYLTRYTTESNAWAEFQRHRGLFGLVAITDTEEAVAGKLYEALRANYSKTLISSRLILLDTSLDSPPPSLEIDNNLPPRNHAHLTVHAVPDPLIDDAVAGMIASLCEGLERARLEKVRADAANVGGKGGASGVGLLLAPFERKDFIGLDLESRQNRKRAGGRFKKNLGDACLQAYLLEDALIYYEGALEVLRSCHDWLWLGSVLEALCCLTVIVAKQESHRLEKSRSLVRNAAKIDEKALLRRLPAKSNELVEKFRELVIHYSKYRQAGIIETEASVKAVRILTEKSFVGVVASTKTLAAAEFMQNVVFINLNLTDMEKVRRFSALSQLYALIGFRRKSAFFHRVAAMRCVAPNNPQPDWALCYDLLCETLEGYRMSTRDEDKEDRSSNEGWPSLQVQIMQELVGTARRMGEHRLAMGHIVGMIDTFGARMEPNTLQMACQELAALSQRDFQIRRQLEIQHQNDPKALAAIPRPMTFAVKALPKLLSFAPRSLPLIPRSGKGRGSSPAGPFLFTPIVSSSSGKKKSKCDWVQGESCDVDLVFAAPSLPFLEVQDLGLTFEGPFEARKGSLTIPAQGNISRNVVRSTSQTFPTKLSGVPLNTGVIKILGYSCTIFGIRNEVNFDDLALEPAVITVHPALPKLETTCKFLGEITPEVIQVYAGEEGVLEILLHNESDLAVGELSVETVTVPHKYRSLAISQTPEDDTDSIEAKQFTRSIVIKGPATVCKRVDPMSEEEEEGDGEEEVEPVTIKFDLTVHVNYGSVREAEEEKSGYLRQARHKVSVEVMPSVSVSWWDVFPSENSDECYLVLDVVNEASGSEAEIHYAENKLIVIDPRAKCRIPLQMKKVAVDPALRGQERMTAFLDRICEQFDIRWKLNAVSRSGLLSLSDLELTEVMMGNMELCDVVWNIFVNGSQWLGVEYKVAPGEVIELEVRLTNPFEENVHFVFEVECHYQDEEEGVSTATTSARGQVNLAVGCGKGVTARSSKKQPVEFRTNFVAPSIGNLVLTCRCEIFRVTRNEKGTQKDLAATVIMPVIPIFVK